MNSIIAKEETIMVDRLFLICLQDSFKNKNKLYMTIKIKGINILK
jgi:hypothetical protein